MFDMSSLQGLFGGGGRGMMGLGGSGGDVNQFEAIRNLGKQYAMQQGVNPSMPDVAAPGAVPQAGVMAQPMQRGPQGPGMSMEQQLAMQGGAMGNPMTDPGQMMGGLAANGNPIGGMDPRTTDAMRNMAMMGMGMMGQGQQQQPRQAAPAPGGGIRQMNPMASPQFGPGARFMGRR